MAHKKKDDKKPLAEPSKEPKQSEESNFVAPIKPYYSLERRGGGWSVVRVKIQDGKVIEEEATPPDRKEIALEAFKIKIAREVIGM